MASTLEKLEHIKEMLSDVNKLKEAQNNPETKRLIESIESRIITDKIADRVGVGDLLKDSSVKWYSYGNQIYPYKTDAELEDIKRRVKESPLNKTPKATAPSQEAVSQTTGLNAADYVKALNARKALQDKLGETLANSKARTAEAKDTWVNSRKARTLQMKQLKSAISRQITQERRDAVHNDPNSVYNLTQGTTGNFGQQVSKGTLPEVAAMIGNIAARKTKTVNENGVENETRVNRFGFKDKHLRKAFEDLAAINYSNFAALNGNDVDIPNVMSDDETLQFAQNVIQQLKSKESVGTLTPEEKVVMGVYNEAYTKLSPFSARPSEPENANYEIDTLTDSINKLNPVVDKAHETFHKERDIRDSDMQAWKDSIKEEADRDYKYQGSRGDNFGISVAHGGQNASYIFKIEKSNDGGKIVKVYDTFNPLPPEDAKDAKKDWFATHSVDTGTSRPVMQYKIDPKKDAKGNIIPEDGIDKDKEIQSIIRKVGNWGVANLSQIRGGNNVYRRARSAIPQHVLDLTIGKSFDDLVKDRPSSYVNKLIKNIEEAGGVVSNEDGKVYASEADLPEGHVKRIINTDSMPENIKKTITGIRRKGTAAATKKGYENISNIEKQYEKAKYQYNMAVESGDTRMIDKAKARMDKLDEELESARSRFGKEERNGQTFYTKVLPAQSTASGQKNNSKFGGKSTPAQIDSKHPEKDAAAQAAQYRDYTNNNKSDSTPINSNIYEVIKGYGN